MQHCPSGRVQNVGCDNACNAIGLLVLDVVLAPASTHKTSRDAKRLCRSDIIVGIANHN